MLLNKSLLAQFSPLPRNYDFSEVMQYVDITELIWISPIIGDDLYNELLEQVKNNNLTEVNSTLLVKAIYPLLGFAVVYESLPFLWSHLSEVGLTLGSSDNSQSLTLKDLTYVQQHLRAQCEVRKDFLIKWVCERSDLFPLICGCDCECNTCCGGNAKLHQPNAWKQLYTTRRKCTDLK